MKLSFKTFSVLNIFLDKLILLLTLNKNLEPFTFWIRATLHTDCDFTGEPKRSQREAATGVVLKKRCS